MEDAGPSTIERHFITTRRLRKGAKSPRSLQTHIKTLIRTENDWLNLMREPALPRKGPAGRVSVSAPSGMV